MTQDKFMQSLKNKIINISPLFQKIGLKTDALSIVETPEMYSYKEKIEDNWAYYTAVGFQALEKILEQEKKLVQSIGIVGIGSGVEGIAALKVFEGLKNLVISDIDQEILVGAVKNVESLAVGSNVEILPMIGSFAEPMQSLPYKFDLIHGNIPNLPSGENQELKFGDEKGTFLPSLTFERYNPPVKFTKWAMAAQVAYLQSAKKVLSPTGSVLTELGGRMPLSVVEGLFKECGYKMQEMLVGFKEQTEAEMDFQGYHQVEKEFGVEFDFYLYQESEKIMRQQGIENPTTQISGEKLKELLSKNRVNASEALKLFNQGAAVGHTVHIFRGTYE